MMKTFRANGEGMKIVKEFEGCQLKAYRDEVGVWTIGYGITNSDKGITGRIIKRGMRITKDTANKWLLESLRKKYSPLVNKYDNIYHWNQNEFEALVSFCFNIGSIKVLTANGTRTKKQIAEKMLSYNKAGGRVYRGLTRRRKAERALFLKAVEPTTYKDIFPVLPPRGYFQIGDGYKTYTEYPTQIKRVQELLNWLVDADLKIDGKYGEDTAKAEEKAQRLFKLTVNGKFGNATLNKAKKYKK